MQNYYYFLPRKYLEDNNSPIFEIIEFNNRLLEYRYMYIEGGLVDIKLEICEQF